MTPRGSLPDPKNCAATHAELPSDFSAVAAGIGKLSDLDNLSIGEFPASLDEARYCAAVTEDAVFVDHVFGTADPLKVLGSVVVLDPVQVVPLRFVSGGSTNERLKDDSVNLDVLLSSEGDESVSLVTLPVLVVLEEARPALAHPAQSSEIRDFVVTFPTNDGTPLFLYDGVSHSRSPETGLVRASRRSSVVGLAYCTAKGAA